MKRIIFLGILLTCTINYLLAQSTEPPKKNIPNCECCGYYQQAWDINYKKHQALNAKYPNPTVSHEITDAFSREYNQIWKVEYPADWEKAEQLTEQCKAQQAAARKAEQEKQEAIRKRNAEVEKRDAENKRQQELQKQRQAEATRQRQQQQKQKEAIEKAERDARRDARNRERAEAAREAAKESARKERERKDKLATELEVKMQADNAQTTTALNNAVSQNKAYGQQMKGENTGAKIGAKHKFNSGSSTNSASANDLEMLYGGKNNKQNNTATHGVNANKAGENTKLELTTIKPMNGTITLPKSLPQHTQKDKENIETNLKNAGGGIYYAVYENGEPIYYTEDKEKAFQLQKEIEFDEKITFHNDGGTINADFQSGRTYEDFINIAKSTNSNVQEVPNGKKGEVIEIKVSPNTPTRIVEQSSQPQTKPRTQETLQTHTPIWNSGITPEQKDDKPNNNKTAEQTELNNDEKY